MINLGTDIDSEWNFTNGDINLVMDYSNMNQAIVNRLNTDADFYNIFYPKYGGNLFEQMGELNHHTIHEYIRIEVESIVMQDPRVSNVTATVTKNGSSSVNCELNVVFYDNISSDKINLIIDANTGVSINTNIVEEL